jgi:hypothetical protein
MTTLPLLTIPVGQHVLVRLERLSALPATVVADDGDELTLVLAASEPDLPALGEVVVEWAAGLGYRRCAGELLEAGERSELLRLRLVSGPELVHSRRWPRVEAVLPVRVDMVDEPGHGGPTTTVNIGAGGLLMSDPWRLRVGAGIRVSVDLFGGGEPPVKALGQVVHAARVDHKGVRFDDISPEGRERIERFVRSHERERVESGIFRF